MFPISSLVVSGQLHIPAALNRMKSRPYELDIPGACFTRREKKWLSVCRESNLVSHLAPWILDACLYLNCDTRDFAFWPARTNILFDNRIVQHFYLSTERILKKEIVKSEVIVKLYVLVIV